MYADASEYSFHGNIRMPMTAVMTPPVTKLILRGLRLEKSLAGETMFAAMLVWSCAQRTTTAATMMTSGDPMRLMTSIGSQMAMPSHRIVALVTATPTNANAVIVVGRPSAWPMACERWL